MFNAYSLAIVNKVNVANRMAYTQAASIHHSTNDVPRLDGGYTFWIRVYITSGIVSLKKSFTGKTGERIFW